MIRKFLLKSKLQGCGKLGRQLATCLLDFAEVYPNELQLSTRQPDTLSI
jgi:hypothetical protein